MNLSIHPDNIFKEILSFYCALS